uniref:Uncharacterized protein n=1 Tax=Cucumis melo TaxID=3656 RepID=A0A9I9EG30_CUCME
MSRIHSVNRIRYPTLTLYYRPFKLILNIDPHVIGFELGTELELPAVELFGVVRIRLHEGNGVRGEVKGVMCERLLKLFYFEDSKHVLMFSYDFSDVPINYMTEVLSPRLYGTVCTQVEIEFPMPDRLPSFAEATLSIAKLIDTGKEKCCPSASRHLSGIQFSTEGTLCQWSLPLSSPSENIFNSSTNNDFTLERRENYIWRSKKLPQPRVGFAFYFTNLLKGESTMTDNV